MKTTRASNSRSTVFNASPTRLQPRAGRSSAESHKGRATFVIGMHDKATMRIGISGPDIPCKPSG